MAKQLAGQWRLFMLSGGLTLLLALATLPVFPRGLPVAPLFGVYLLLEGGLLLVLARALGLAPGLGRLALVAGVGHLVVGAGVALPRMVPGFDLSIFVRGVGVWLLFTGVVDVTILLGWSYLFGGLYRAGRGALLGIVAGILGVVAIVQPARLPDIRVIIALGALYWGIVQLGLGYRFRRILA